jgi:hypothetical protein
MQPDFKRRTIFESRGVRRPVFSQHSDENYWQFTHLSAAVEILCQRVRYWLQNHHRPAARLGSRSKVIMTSRTLDSHTQKLTRLHLASQLSRGKNPSAFQVSLRQAATVFVIVGALLTLLVACASVEPGTNTIAGHDAPTATASPRPEYLAAQKTLAAGQAEAQNLANQAAAVALEITQASATEAYFTRQTQVAAEAQTQAAISAQQTQASDSMTATQAAINAQSTQAAHITQTADAILTMTTWPMTATPLAGTQAAVVIEVEKAERRAYWSQFVAPFWAFIGVVMVVLVIAAIGYTFWRLLPALELRLRTFEGKDGEIVTYLPKTNLLTLLPGRIAGPALHSSEENSQISGLAPDLGLQDRTLERHQMIRLAQALPPGKATSAIKKAGFPEPEINGGTPNFRVLDRGELPPMLDAGTMEYLETEWRDSND